MRSRMDRYRKLENDSGNSTYSRSDKNKELYQNLGNNTKYTNFTDVSRVNAVSLEEAKRKSNTREGYHSIKEYQDVRPKVRKELDEFNYLYQDHENRVYDINNFIKNAKENRKEIDEKEAKRKLKNTNYNILASLNKNELEKNRKEKVERNKPDEKELRGLIDTITSKTLAGEISKDTGVNLLSDLMATNVMDRVDSSKADLPKEDTSKLELSSEILDKDSIKKIEKAKKEEESKPKQSEILKDMDNSFYTKSMDLSDKDFDFGDIDERKVPVIVKILLILILLALIGIGVYFIIQKI